MASEETKKGKLVTKDSKVWFVGSAFPDSLGSYFAAHYFGANTSVSNLIYDRRLFEAAVKDGIDAKMFSLPHVGTYPSQSKKAYVTYPNENPGYVPVPFNCFFLLKHLSQKHHLQKALMTQWREAGKPSDLHVVICEAYLPYLQGVYSLYKKARNLRVTVIVPDLPENVGRIGKGLRAVLKKRYIKKSNCMMRLLATDFVLFTEPMKAISPYQNQPCIVSNGICQNPVIAKKEKNLFVFAGKLTEKNGVRLILEAISKLKCDAVFEFYGNGPLSDEVTSAARSDARIVFGGYQDPKFVENRMSTATGIIATRCSSGQSPYQFPSKVLNALSFMSPVICFDLPVFSEKLRETLLIVPEDADSLATAFSDVLNGKYGLDLELRKEVVESYSASALVHRIIGEN